jgi:hypothetical protein
MQRLRRHANNSTNAANLNCAKMVIMAQFPKSGVSPPPTSIRLPATMPGQRESLARFTSHPALNPHRQRQTHQRGC